jgi:hypothetical protein
MEFFIDLLVLGQAAPNFNGIVNSISTALRPLVGAVFSLGLILVLLGTIASPFMPSFAQENKGYILKAGVAAMLIGLVPSIAAWLVGIGTTAAGSGS